MDKDNVNIENVDKGVESDFRETDTSFRQTYIEKTQGKTVDEDWFQNPVTKNYIYSEEGQESTGVIKYPLLLITINTQEMANLVYKDILKKQIKVNTVVPEDYKGMRLFIYQELEGEAFYRGEFIITSEELSKLKHLGVSMKWVPEKGKREKLKPEDIFDYSVFNPLILEDQEEEPLKAEDILGDLGYEDLTSEDIEIEDKTAEYKMIESLSTFNAIESTKEPDSDISISEEDTEQESSLEFTDILNELEQINNINSEKDKKETDIKTEASLDWGD